MTAGLYPVPDDVVPATAIASEMAWADRALCAEVGPELFYPGKGGDVRPAKRVCMACEVRAECLEYALAHSEDQYDAGSFGIWGGLSPAQRQRLSRQQRAA